MVDGKSMEIIILPDMKGPARLLFVVMNVSTVADEYWPGGSSMKL